MPIKIACKCGRTLSVPDNLAGKAVKCPQCDQPLRIPRPQKAAATAAAPVASGLEDLLDEIGLTGHRDEYEGLHCPSCNAPLAQNAALCVECGLNLETGKFVKGILPLHEKQQKKKAEGHEGAAELLLGKAVEAIKAEKVDQVKNRTEGMPLWLLISSLSVIATLALSMALMASRAQAMELSGWVCVCVFGFFAWLHGLRLLIMASSENWQVGLMYAFVPFYALYYIATRWQKCGRMFLDHCVSLALCLIGVGMLMVAPWFSDGTETGRLTHPGGAGAVAAASAPL
jgi:hypothetical protein